MNQQILLYLCLIFSGSIFAQFQWENVPQATQFSPTDIEFIDLNNGWASTINGYIAHTNDGGDTWSLQGNYSVYNGLTSIDMLSTTHGYASGYHGIFETTDGLNWNELINEPNGYFLETQFLNDTLGILMSNYELLKTTDGGQTWDTIFIESGYNLFALQFVDENMIVAVGNDLGYGNIIVSHDGGLSWDEPDDAAGLPLTDVYFTTSLLGYAVGHNGTYLTTVDGGLTWQNSTQFQNMLNPSPSIYFISEMTGFVRANNNQYFQTTDGGNTWTDLSSPKNRNFEQTFFLDSLHGWATSSVLTEIISTSDGGQSWASMYNGSGWELTDVKFSSDNDGWACGLEGTILHTTDNGSSWSLVDSPISSMYTKIGVADTQNIWVIGVTGVSFHTSDGGVNWDSYQFLSGGDLMDIDFPTPQVGYIAGPSYIHKTLDGGVNWTSDWHPGINYNSISFLNQDTGMVCTTEFIFKTVDGGSTWQNITPTVGLNAYNSIEYPATDTAYAVGYQGVIVSTYDGGITWTLQNSGTTSILKDITFSSSTHGRVSGYDGTILVTLDAGVTWLPESTPSQITISAVANTPDNQIGWASKQDGNLLKFHCSTVNPVEIMTYTLSPATNCNGSVKLSSVSSESFATTVSGQNKVIAGSGNLSGFCEGLYSLEGGYTSCGNDLDGLFVVTDPNHFYGTTAYADSTIAYRSGNVQEFCGQQLIFTSSAKLISAAFINSSTIEAQWEIVTASGTFIIPAQYPINGNGMYAIQLSLYCEGNTFEGLIVNENIYIETNTVTLKNSELQTENFFAFPNPASSLVTLRFESGAAKLTIRDINGKELFSKEVVSNDQIDLSGFSNGILLFEISTEKGRAVKRMIKN
ncbi:YCF48-related protein [Fluviicola sp.]|uniref:YCF48-related protein n=1 Tax=Fluviicola sp. TaxID=1917219 RepID=UPI0031DC5853